MPQESNKKCLDDSIVVDTSIPPFSGSFGRILLANLNFSSSYANIKVLNGCN